MDEIDLIEVNEAFSSIPLAWARAMTGGDLSRVNVNGGAIARGHPMGATGGMLMANLVGELERRGKRYGLLTMCESGGTANATIVERVEGPSPAYPLASPPVGRPAPAPAGGSCLLTMGAALRAVVSWKGDLPAITTLAAGQPTRTMSFRELERASNRLARAYASLGVERNQFVTICLPSGAEMLVSSFATWKLGASPNNVSGSMCRLSDGCVARLGDTATWRASV